MFVIKFFFCRMIYMQIIYNWFEVLWKKNCIFGGKGKIFVFGIIMKSF